MTLNNLSRQAQLIQKKHWPNLSLPALVFMTDHRRIANPTPVIAKLPKSTLVIIRDYDHTHRTTYAYNIANECRSYSQPFLIAGDEALSLQTKAYGIHLPQHQMSDAIKLHQRHPNWWITTSVHNLQSLLHANELPVNAIFLSPIFQTPSHPNTKPLGVEQMNHLIAQSIHPVFALGGINENTLSQLKNSKLAGFSCISPLIIHS